MLTNIIENWVNNFDRLWTNSKTCFYEVIKFPKIIINTKKRLTNYVYINVTKKSAIFKVFNILRNFITKFFKKLLHI